MAGRLSTGAVSVSEETTSNRNPFRSEQSLGAKKVPSEQSHIEIQLERIKELAANITTNPEEKSLLPKELSMEDWLASLICGLDRQIKALANEVEYEKLRWLLNQKLLHQSNLEYYSKKLDSYRNFIEQQTIEHTSSY